jgi:hypothetical protein
MKNVGGGLLVMDITGEVLINMRADSTGAVDKTGNTWNCTVPISSTGGKFTDYAFNSSHDINQYIKLQSTDDLQKFVIPANPTFTFSCWVNNPIIDDLTTILSIYPTSTSNFGIFISVGENNNRNMYIMINDNSIISTILYSTNIQIKKEWAHLAFVGNNGLFSSFYNGVRNTQITKSILSSPITPTAANQIQLLTEGNTTSSRPRNYIGLIDDIVFIKGQCLWDKKYFKVPTTYLIDGGYNQSYDNPYVLKQY